MQWPESFTSIDGAKGQFILFLTFLANIILQIYRERRTRKWQLEDEKRKSKELAEHEERMKQELNSQTLEIERRMKTRIAEMGNRFDAVLMEESQIEQRRGHFRYTDRPETQRPHRRHSESAADAHSGTGDRSGREET